MNAAFASDMNYYNSEWRVCQYPFGNFPPIYVIFAGIQAKEEARRNRYAIASSQDTLTRRL